MRCNHSTARASQSNPSVFRIGYTGQDVCCHLTADDKTNLLDASPTCPRRFFTANQRPLGRVDAVLSVVLALQNVRPRES